MMSKIDFGASATKCSTQVGWSYENAPKIFGFEVEGVFAGDKNQNMPNISFKGDAKNSILGGWCNDVVLGALCWTPEAKAFLTEKPGAFRAAMHFQPSWQDDTQFSSETNNVRSASGVLRRPGHSDTHSQDICVWQTVHVLMNLCIKTALRRKYAAEN